MYSSSRSVYKHLEGGKLLPYFPRAGKYPRGGVPGVRFCPVYRTSIPCAAQGYNSCNSVFAFGRCSLLTIFCWKRPSDNIHGNAPRIRIRAVRFQVEHSTYPDPAEVDLDEHGHDIYMNHRTRAEHSRYSCTCIGVPPIAVGLTSLFTILPPGVLPDCVSTRVVVLHAHSG